MFSNLFTIFDPSTSFKYLNNWLSLMIPFFMFPKLYWFKNSKWFFCIKMIIMFLFNELKNLMKKKNYNNITMFMVLFFFLFFFNFMGLFPYIFTPSSHLTISLPLSLSLWLGIMIFNWIIKTNNSFAHLVPLSTPSLLTPFMVIIETISNIIRPMTLAIRLSANMIAGHLLLCLLGSTGNSMMYYMLIIMISIQLMLFTLELAVSIIQTYVFMTLSSLYSNEI